MRLFVASFFSDLMLDWLTKSALSLLELFPPRSLRLTKPDNLHLTYHFLGEVPGSKAAQVSAQLESALEGIEPIVCNPGVVGLFPNKFRPRTLWIGVEPAQNFQFLASRIRRSTEGLAAAETKRFLPHVTLARFNEEHSALRTADPMLVTLPPFGISEIDRTIDSVVLCKSELTPRGPIYSELSHFCLSKYAKL